MTCLGIWCRGLPIPSHGGVARMVEIRIKCIYMRDGVSLEGLA